MKTITLLIAILFAAGLINSRAQNTWKRKADVGGLGRELAVGFSIGSKGYIGTGINGTSTFLSDFWEYNPCDSGLTVYADADNDGNAADTLFVADCTVPNGYVTDSTDCDDTNNSEHPGAKEIIGDGIDNNCNGLVDENVNNSLSFDGVDDYVHVGSIGISSINTRELWFKPNSLAGSSNQYFMDFGSNNYWIQLLDVDGDGKLELRAGAGNSTWLNGIAEFTDTAKWYYIAVTVNSSGILTIYVNGNYDNSGSVFSGFPGALVLGRYGGGSQYFKGSIDEVRIWNVSRTQAEIKSDMAGAVCGNTSGLVAYYPFNQGIAGGINTGVTKADDVTANNNNGILTNFALAGAKSNWVTGVPGLSGMCDCPAPTGLKVQGISDTSAVLKWQVAGANILHVKLRFRAVGDTAWAIRTNDAAKTKRHIHSLIPNTTYEWQLRRFCAEDSSGWVKGPNFTTAASLNPGTKATAYPNPANNTVTVNYTTTRNGKYIFEITSASGNVVLRKETNAIPGTNRITLDISRFFKGVYFINIIKPDMTRERIQLNKE